MRTLASLVLLAASLAPLTARAQEDGHVDNRGGGTASATPGGWREIIHPEQREARARLDEGLALLLRAMVGLDAGLGDEPEWLALERALLRFEHARRVIPLDPTLAYYTACALTEWTRTGIDGGTEYRTDEAVDAWHALRALDREFLAGRVAYHLAMLHMRRHEMEAARDEYLRALALAVPARVRLAYRFYVPASEEEALTQLYAPISPASIHGNLAEALMLTGDTRGAERHYRAAMHTTEDPFTRALALWGLALALERSGDHEGALEHAGRAMRSDPVPPDDPRFANVVERHGRFAVLHLHFVFFEPPYEIHAYEALGYEAIAGAALDPEPARLDDALTSWRLFLAEGGVTSRFGAQARERVRDLEARARPRGGEGGPRRGPPRAHPDLRVPRTFYGP